MQANRRIGSAVPVIVGVFLFANAADAALIRFDAALNTLTQEFVDGEPVSFDESFEQFELTSADLPLHVISSLLFPNSDGGLVATGQGFADFFEPQVGLFINPAEFALEADCFSIEPHVSYQVTSSVEETRTIAYNRDELRLPADSDPVDVEVTSSVFISGAIIVWSEDPFRDLSGLFGDVEFKVELLRSGPGSETSDSVEPELLFVTNMGVTGQADGVVQPFIAGVGTFLFGGTDLIRDLLGSDPAGDDFDRMGEVWIMVIPAQILTYKYPARPDEEFQLHGSFSVDINNLPGGTGVSAVFGRDFETLGEIITEAFRDREFPIDGNAAQAKLNEARAKAPSPEVQVVQTGVTADNAAPTASGMCGAIGAEAVGMILLGFLVTLAPASCGRRQR